MTPYPQSHGRPRPPLALAIGASLLLLWLPLPFASVTPQGVFIFRLAAALLLLGAGALIPFAPARNPVAIPAAALVLVAGLGLLQARLGCPDILRQHAHNADHAMTENEADLIEFPCWRPFSVSPRASREAALNWASAAALLVVGGWLGRHRMSRRLAGGALLAGGVFQMLYGVPRWRGNTDAIWGAVVAGGDRLRGTFINPNHLASFLGLVLPVLLAWVWWASRRAADQELWERKLLLVAPPALGWLLVFVALAFTGSRGGLAAALATLIAQAVLLATRKRRSKLAPLLAVVPALALGTVAIVGLEQGLGRWLATSPHQLAWNTRTEVFAATVDLWRMAPVFGTGLGTFRDAFPLVEPAFSGIAFTHAHNDYLELLATTGIVGVLALLLGAGALATRIFRIFRVGSRREDRAAALAGMGILVALAVHAVVEFGLSIPAVSGTAALLLGLAAGAPTQSQSR